MSNQTKSEADGAISSSTLFGIVVVNPREILVGMFLEGPRDSKQVRRDGYGFTMFSNDAWTFSTQKSATAKARIVARHMGWAEEFLAVESLPNTELNCGEPQATSTKKDASSH